MDDTDDEVFDVLSAMSAHLVNEKPSFDSTNRKGSMNLIDHNKVDYSKLQTSKPSPDLFYRDTQLFTNKLPLAIPVKRCFCKYLCHGEGAKATIQCFSCTIYEVNNKAYYCADCFQARHPWYRVQHFYESIINDEDIVYNMNLSKQSAEFRRVEKESKSIMNTLSSPHDKLDHIQDDHAIDKKLRTVGRNLTQVESKLTNLQDNYETEVHQQRLLYHMRKVLKLQAVYRGYLLRRTVSLVYADRVLCVWDLKHSAYFFFDKINKSSSWYPPRFVLQRDYEKLERCSMNDDGNIIRHTDIGPELSTKDYDQQQEY